MERAKTICLDFDGVLNTYDGWKGPDVLFDPRPGTQGFLQSLKDSGYRLVICSTRQAKNIEAWLKEHKLDGFIEQVCATKPAAWLYLDDRAVAFNGNFDSALADIRAFTGAHWERPAISRPTIAELEAILQHEEETEIEILPNGEIRAKGMTAPSEGLKHLTYREHLGGEYGDSTIL